MDINTIYKINNRIDDLASVNYPIPRRYQTTQNFKRLQPKRSPKRQSFLDEVLKHSKSIPAPNQYQNNPESNKSKKSIAKKINFEQQMKKGKHTYIDDIVKAKKKVPLVGKYHLEQKIDKQKLRKYRMIGDKIKTAAPLFRPTYSQSINGVESLNTGPGCYKDYHKFKIGQSSPKFTIGILKTKQQESKIKEKEKKKSLSLAKLPSAASYNPVPNDFSTFESISKIKSSSLKKCTFGMKFSLPNLGKQIPGPKYNVVNDWGTAPKFPAKSSSHNNILNKIVSGSPKRSIYH